MWGVQRSCKGKKGFLGSALCAALAMTRECSPLFLRQQKTAAVVIHGGRCYCPARGVSALVLMENTVALSTSRPDQQKDILSGWNGVYGVDGLFG
jgi:hypothetical protein